MIYSSKQYYDRSVMQSKRAKHGLVIGNVISNDIDKSNRKNCNVIVKFDFSNEVQVDKVQWNTIK